MRSEVVDKSVNQKKQSHTDKQINIQKNKEKIVDITHTPFLNIGRWFKVKL